jgi:DnaJ-class molecular chaperone
MDLYAVLGVTPEISNENIKKIYKKLILKEHPDKGGDAGKFQEITNAYHILSNPEYKDIYLKTGIHSLEKIRTILKERSIYRPITKEELGRKIYISLDESGRSRKPPPLKRALALDMKDIYLGKSFKVTINTRDFCSVCKGKKYINKKVCSGCDGTGLVDGEPKDYTIEIPPGTKQGSIVYIPGGNGNQVGFEEKGDLHLTINIRKTKGFRRDGDHIRIKCNLTLKEALCGFKKEFVHLSGDKIAISSNKPIQQGQTQRIEGYGFPSNEPGGQRAQRGDLILEYHIQIPNEISDEFKRQCLLHLP